MAENPGIISNTIIVNATDAEVKIKSLRGQLGALKQAYERAFVGDGTTVFKKETVSAEELKQKITEVTRQISLMNTAMNQGTAKDSSLNGAVKNLENIDKAAKKAADSIQKAQDKVQKLNDNFRSDSTLAQNKVNRSWESERNQAYQSRNNGMYDANFVAQIKAQFKTREEISSAKERTNVAAQTKLYEDQNRSIKANSDAIKEQMNTSVTYDKYIASLATKYNRQDAKTDARESQIWAQYAKSSQNAKPQDYQSYAKQIQAARLETERLHQEMVRLGTVESRINFANARNGLLSANRASEEFNRSIGIGRDRMGQYDAFVMKLQSHMRWITAGALISAAAAVPIGSMQILKEVELGMAGIQQVVPRLHESRQALNEESIAIIDIAARFGLSVNDIIESYKLWARAYKDTDVVQTLVNSAATLAKADNFSLTEANKAIEGIMLQFGVFAKTSEEAHMASMKIVDSITNVSHNAMVSAQDLAAANIRSASAAKQAGVSFDFLQGMIGTMSRNTGRAGGEIGNAIRSMLVSIHSDKAVKEIEKMGVAMYKVGADGTKSFRDVEEVITELMLVSDATDKNIEKMMLSISGGKFQYNKVASLIGDYNELIRVTDLSINSQGIATKQTAMQLDTIASKLATVKAQLESMVVGAGNSGLTQYIKESIDSIGIFIARLGTIKAESWQAMGSVMKFAFELRMVVFALSKLAGMATLATTAKAAYATATTSAAMAESRLATQLALASIVSNTNASSTARLAAANELQAIAANTAAVANGRNATMMTIATGGLNLLIPLIIGGTAAYALYNTESAESVKAIKAVADAETKLSADLQDKAANTQSEIDLMQNKLKFMGTLANTYPMLIEQSQKEGITAEETAKIKEKLATTEQALIHTLGEEAMQRIKDAGNTKEAIDIEVKALKDAQDAKANVLIEERKAIYSHSTMVADKAKDRLEAIKAETLGLAIEAEKQALLYEGISGAQRSKLKFEMNEAYKGINAGAAESGESVGSPTGIFSTVEKAKLDKYLAAKKAFDDFDTQYVADTQEELKKNIAIAKANQNPYDPQNALNGGDGNTGVVADSEGKNKSTGKAEPSDHAEQIQRIANQAEYRNIINSIDIAEKNHTNTLGKLATQEAIYGNTIGLTLEKQKANRDFIITLGAEYDSLETLKQGYIEQLEGELSTNSELNETLSLAIPNWTALTKAQQREQAKLNSELFQSFKTADALNKLIGEIEGKQVGLHNSADNLRNEETKTNLGGTGDVIKQSNRRISGIKDQESIDIANATNKVDANNDIELNRIKLKALYDQQFEHDAQIKFLISEVDKASIRGMPGVLEAKQDELRKERVLYAQNAAAIKDLEYEKNSKIKEGLYGITQEVLIQGNSLKSVWNNLWTTLANDALKALFKVQNGSGGLLNSVLGILGGSSGSGSSGGSIGGYSQKVIGSLSGKTYFADGGLVSKPTNAVIGETGDTEAVINLGKLQKGDSRQKGLLSYANSKQGTQVEASVSQRTMDIAQQTSIIGKQTQIQSQHITELQRANELMMQQNNMILHMINNGSGSQSAIAQPIVMSQSMSDSEFFAKIQKLKAQGYPMG